jgi:hypothetical protein
MLECLGLSLACGREGDDGDVMVARLVRPTLRLLPGQVACMAASCCFRVTWLPGQVACMAAGCCFRVTWRFAPPHASVASLESCAWACAPVGVGDLSCEAETCRVRPRLVVQGGDLSCEGSSSGKLVRDAGVWPRAGRLASEGLDENLHASPEMQPQVKGGLLLDDVVSKGTTILELLANKRLTPP